MGGGRSSQESGGQLFRYLLIYIAQFYSDNLTFIQIFLTLFFVGLRVSMTIL